MVNKPCSLDQDVSVAGPSRPKCPRIENSFLESLRASSKEEITSEYKNLLVESQKDLLKLLKPETRENVRENTAEETEKETRGFYNPTKSVMINSTRNNDPCSSRNTSIFVRAPICTNYKFPRLYETRRPLSTAFFPLKIQRISPGSTHDLASARQTHYQLRYLLSKYNSQVTKIVR